MSQRSRARLLDKRCIWGRDGNLNANSGARRSAIACCGLQITLWDSCISAPLYPGIFHFCAGPTLHVCKNSLQKRHVSGLLLVPYQKDALRCSRYVYKFTDVSEHPVAASPILCCLFGQLFCPEDEGTELHRHVPGVLSRYSTSAQKAIELSCMSASLLSEHFSNTITPRARVIEK